MNAPLPAPGLPLPPVIVAGHQVRDPGPPGRPLLWGHGVTGAMAAEDRAPLVDWSTVPGIRAIRYDARGHGATPGPEDPDCYRWDRLAADRWAVLDGLGIERAVLGGASMGAATAVIAALSAPERVEALVLVIPPTAWSTRPAQARTYRIGAGLLGLPAGRTMFLTAIRHAPLPPVLRGEGAALSEALRAGMEMVSGPRLAAILRGAAQSDLPPAAELARLSMPVLILAWATDPSHPLSTAETLAGTLPQATLHVARTAAQVKGWTAEVAGFLASLH